MATRIPQIGTPFEDPNKSENAGTFNKPWFLWFQQVDAAIQTLPPAPQPPPPPAQANIQIQNNEVDVGIPNPHHISFDANLTVTAVGNDVRVVATTGGGSTPSIALNPRWVILGGSDSIASRGIQGADLSVSANQLGGSQSNSSILTSQKRTVFAVGTDALVIGFATTNSSAAAKNGIFRNATNNQGSFYLRVLFGVEQKGANPDSFCCCLGSAPTSVSSITTAPSTGITDCFGFVKDRTDTNWQVARRTGTGAVTKIDLGLAPAAGQIFFVEFLSVADASSIRLRVSRIDSSSTLVDTTYTTTLPDPAVSLALYLAGVAAGTGNTGVAIIEAQFYESKLTLPTPLAF